MAFVAGFLGMVIGHDVMGGFTEYGSIAAIAVMGAFVINFNEKKK